jgi:hypothetical protein
VRGRWKIISSARNFPLTDLFDWSLHDGVMSLQNCRTRNFAKLGISILLGFLRHFVILMQVLSLPITKYNRKGGDGSFPNLGHFGLLVICQCTSLVSICINHPFLVVQVDFTFNSHL